MNGLNIKNLQTSEPYTLYSDLEEAVQFSEAHTTSKVEDDNYGEGYLLAGLYMSNLNDAGLDEEQIARLSNALETENIRYALFPNDQRQGYLPLVLNETTRTYLESTIDGLFSNQVNVKWYIYFLPNDIDPDNNELSGSIMKVDEFDEPITVEYNEIENYFINNGHVEDSNEDDMFEKDEYKPTNDGKEDEVDEDTSSELAYVEDDDEELEFNIDDEENTSLDFDDEEIEDFDDITEDKTDEQKSESNEVSKDEVLDIEDEIDKEPDLKSDTDVQEAQNDVNSENEQDVNKSDENGFDGENVADIEVNEAIESYAKIPESLNLFLNNISVRKFSDFEKDGLNPVTVNTMQKEIDYANSHIDEYVYNIKRKAIDQYQKHMKNSHDSIREAIDTNTGDEAVKDYYQNVLSKEESIENQYNADVEAYLTKLEEEFYTTRLEDYKNELLAKAKKWHEEENLERLVKQPLHEYKTDRRNYYDERKVESRSDFNSWLANIEDVAKGKDQAQAVEKAKALVNEELEGLNIKINQLNENMHKLNNKLISIEYDERATENIRRSAGENLETDHQAKIYKQQVDDLIKEKADLQKQFKEDLQKKQTDIEEKQKSFESTINSVKKDHDNELLAYQKNVDKYKNEANSIKSENDKLKEENNKNKRKNMRNYVISFVAAAVLFSGGGYAFHSASESQHKDEIKKQESLLKSTKSDLSKKEKELSDEKANSSKVQDEQNKKLQDTEQRLKDTEKKLKEAEDKAKKEDKKKKDK